MSEQQKVIDALNEAFRRDPNAIRALLCNRVPCNQDLADDPFVQVGRVDVIESGTWEVGMLGVVNGVLGSLNVPLVAASFGDNGKLLGFCGYVPAETNENP